MSNSHYFHLVEESPWPILSAVFRFRLTIGLTKWFHINCLDLIVLGLISLIITAFLWWRDISRERRFQGNHTKIVEIGLRWGIILFITSEVFFFLSFFWAFFHSSLAPNIELGSQWPPKGINVFNPIEVPILNTIILISSGIRVTWCHKAIEINNHRQRVTGLLIRIILGLYFTALQGIEYFEASFSIADSVYGRTFFIGTGFHGLHVIVGTLFLIICLLRLSGGIFRVSHHIGLIAAIWYWHFVDVVWLFLYCRFYVWGSWGV
jgi:cytochrome c oxidase subunit 3